MSQNVSQWLAEIKSLQRQLAEAQAAREEAYTIAANWQQRYETEAQQRRMDASRTRQTIADLEQKIAYLKGMTPQGEPTMASASLQEEVAQLASLDLQERLLNTLVERDRLLQALADEQASHEETRRRLTTALGDAIGVFSKGTDSPP